MSLALRLRTMAAVLHQGRKANTLALGLLGLAAFAVLVGLLASTPAIVLACLSLVPGVIAAYFGARVDLDARLLDALAEQADASPPVGDDELALRLDRSLQELGLIGSNPPPRDWDARWLGMRRLLRRQLASLTLQVLLLLAAAWVAAGSASGGT